MYIIMTFDDLDTFAVVVYYPYCIIQSKQVEKKKANDRDTSIQIERSRMIQICLQCTLN